MVQTCIRWGTLAAALVVMAACSGDSTISGPGPASYTLAPIPNDGTMFDAVPGAVKVCTFDGPAIVTTSQNPPGGGTSIEANSDLILVECSITWLSNGQAGPFEVTVTQTGPDTPRLRRLAVLHTDPAQTIDIIDPLGCDGTDDIPTSATVNVGGDAGAVIWLKQCAPLPPPPPPPPPADCHGLTPGFWKNWANHYTAEQFALIIDGTSFADESNAFVTSVLNGNNPAIVRLKKFVYANELTMSLTALGNTVPNPSGGSISGTCSIGGEDLADALALAHLMLANPGDYTNGQINNLGSLLDAFANMDD